MQTCMNIFVLLVGRYGPFLKAARGEKSTTKGCMVVEVHLALWDF